MLATLVLRFLARPFALPIQFMAATNAGNRRPALNPDPKTECHRQLQLPAASQSATEHAAIACNGVKHSLALVAPGNQCAQTVAIATCRQEGAAGESTGSASCLFGQAVNTLVID